jgi:APA family basic amino acid/polyamine antiporter
MLFLLPGNIRDVALIANFTLFVTFIVINAAVIRLRKTMPDTPRPYRVPGAIRNVPVPAVLGIATCVFFLFQIDLPVIVIGIFLMIGAAIIGWVLRRRAGSPDKI